MSKMRASVRDNLKTYLRGEWRFQKEDLLQKTDLRGMDPAEVKFLDPEGTGKKSHDYENAVTLFEFWKDMNPTQATDIRLWTYLCHGPFMSYLRKRRPIEDEPAASRESYIIKHWFVLNSGGIALKQNDLYLFWWGPYITHDETRKDPYELTKELFSMLDYTRHLLPATQGQNRHLTHAVLEYVIENPGLFKQFKEAKVRLIMRRLNRIAGYRVLIALDKTEIKNVIQAFESDIRRETSEEGG